MISCGLASSLSSTVFYFLAFGFLAVVFWVCVMRGLLNLFQEAQARALKPDDDASINFLRVSTLVIWSMFPLIWFLSMCDLISPNAAEYATCVCDCSAKLVYSLLLADHSFMKIERTDVLFMLEMEEVFNNPNTLT